MKKGAERTKHPPGKEEKKREEERLNLIRTAFRQQTRVKSKAARLEHPPPKRRRDLGEEEKTACQRRKGIRKGGRPLAVGSIKKAGPPH